MSTQQVLNVSQWCGLWLFQWQKGSTSGRHIITYFIHFSEETIICHVKEGLQMKKFPINSKWRRLSLTHICFADDAPVFTKGEFDSVEAVLCILHKFSWHTGLSISTHKIALLAGGVVANDAELWANNMSINLLPLPAKYMGLPLCSSRLSTKDCLPLHVNITRIKSGS